MEPRLRPAVDRSRQDNDGCVSAPARCGCPASAAQCGFADLGDRLAMSSCHDCGRQYGNQHGFTDLIIPYLAWKEISPTGDDGGLLCPRICQRLASKGISCEGAFMSGPIATVSRTQMELLRRIENIELAIEGRNNRWSGIRSLIDSSGWGSVSRSLARLFP